MFDTWPLSSSSPVSVSLGTWLARIGIAAGVTVVLGGLYFLHNQTNPDLEAHAVDQPPEATASAELQKTLWVDVGGAVNKPGVYSLPSTSRVADALSAADGLAKTADSYFVNKTLNSAEKLTDGQKIYIPSKAEILAEQEKKQEADKTSDEETPDTASGKISINSASVKELDELAGIGAKRAEDIIAGRPYASLADLVTKKIITQSVFDDIENEIEL